MGQTPFLVVPSSNKVDSKPWNYLFAPSRLKYNTIEPFVVGFLPVENEKRNEKVFLKSIETIRKSRWNKNKYRNCEIW